MQGYLDNAGVRHGADVAQLVVVRRNLLQDSSHDLARPEQEI